MQERKPVAAIATVYNKRSHADVIIGKILEGYNYDGGEGPRMRLVSMYVDQLHEKDMSLDLAKKFGFKLCGKIEDALTLGTNKLAVAGVLNIGEHGNYPEN